MRILINTPYIKDLGGVANHYLGLKPYFSNVVKYHQFITSATIHRITSIKLLHKPLGILSLTFDFLKFFFILLFNRFPIVLLNPSFLKTALNRDQIFLRIAKLFNCRVAIFMHGWDLNVYNEVLENGRYNYMWKQSDAFFVLANEFKKNLLNLGVTAPIYLTTTKVDDRLIKDLPLGRKITTIRNILFLARVERNKGVFTAIEAFSFLSEKKQNLTLTIVGGGSSLQTAKEFVIEKRIENVIFTGPLFGEDLKKAYLDSHLYLLPTTHGEGMPTTVLEAMAFGLPVISRPVGGLKDFFEKGRMGFLIDTTDPLDYVEIIDSLISDPDLTKRISEYNSEYARSNFMASRIAPDIESKLLAMMQ